MNNDNSDSLEKIGNAQTEQADLHICDGDPSTGTEDLAVVEKLSVLKGRDVAVVTKLTGAPDKTSTSETSTRSDTIAESRFRDELGGAVLQFPPLTSAPAVDNGSLHTASEYQSNDKRWSTDAGLIVLDLTDGLMVFDKSRFLSITKPIEPTNHTQTTTTSIIISGENQTVFKGISSVKGYTDTFSVDPEDEYGRFIIDTVVKDNMLSVSTWSTIDPKRSDGVTSFTVTLANGQSLPDWITNHGHGEYLIDRSVDHEVVGLKVVAYRESGATLTRLVEIDIVTGLISEPQLQSTAGDNFYQVFEKGASNDDRYAKSFV